MYVSMQGEYVTNLCYVRGGLWLEAGADNHSIARLFSDELREDSDNRLNKQQLQKPSEK